MKCPNVECKTNKDENLNSEIIYVRYDNNNLKYIYIYSHAIQIGYLIKKLNINK